MDEDTEQLTAESHAGTVFRHSLMTLGSRVGIVLVNIPTSILIARMLGAEGQGAYTSAIVFPSIFAFIGLLGIDASHTFLLSRRRYSAAQINGQSALLSVLVTAYTVPAYLVFLRFYGGASDPELRALLGLGAVLIPVLLLKYLAVAFLLGLQKIKWFNAANIIQAASLLIFMVANLLVFRGGVRGAVLAYLASEVTVGIVGLRMALREAGGGALIERPPPEMLRKSVKYGLQGHVGNVLVQFTYRFDMFLILSMLGVGAQGLYSIAVILAEKLVHIPRSVQVVLFPKLSSLPVEESNELTPRVLRNALFLTALAGVALYLLSRPLLVLFYGTEFVGGLRSFRVLLPGVVMLTACSILSGDFSARDRRIYHTIANAIGFAVNVSLCLLWIPAIGIEGAAWASTVAYSLEATIMLLFFRKLSGRGILESTVIGADDLRLYLRILGRVFGRTGG
jgi:O-antigen/teichoic acid export membrane protein